MTKMVRQCVSFTPEIQKKIKTYAEKTGSLSFSETMRSLVYVALRAEAQKDASGKRRVHSSIDSLPEKLRKTLTKMLVDDKWPEDFLNHYNGTPQYIDLLNYCKIKGYNLSLGAVGRFGKRIKAIQSKKIVRDKGQRHES